ncbi:hypothetical protein A9G22_04370 [Gilliamella sp. App2-1]|nr:hypothetical protein A9G22_04370 [Gilliamella apicola]
MLCQEQIIVDVLRPNEGEKLLRPNCVAVFGVFRQFSTKSLKLNTIIIAIFYQENLKRSNPMRPTNFIHHHQKLDLYLIKKFGNSLIFFFISLI